jgi:hypothetical protein
MRFLHYERRNIISAAKSIVKGDKYLIRLKIGLSKIASNDVEQVVSRDDISDLYSRVVFSNLG